jgi:hypothetical protein
MSFFPKMTYFTKKILPTGESRSSKSTRTFDDTQTMESSTLDKETVTTLSFKQFAEFVLSENGDFSDKTRKIANLRTQYIDVIKKYLAKWIESPFVDPFDDKPIVLEKTNINFTINAYQDLYHLFCKFIKYTNKHYNILDITQMLPKEHLLFDKKLDILAYRADSYNSKAYDKFQIYFGQNIENVVYNLKPTPGYEKYGYDELTIVYRLTSLYIQVLANYINDVGKMFTTDTMAIYDTFLPSMYENIKHLEFIKDFVETYDTYEILKIMINKHIFKIQQKLEKLNANTSAGFINGMRDSVMKSSNYIENLLNKYQELVKIYDYKNNPDEFPFVNLDNIKFSTIEDPLVKILNQIGIQEIDLKTLDLEPRVFTDDQQYKDYQKQFKALKDEYIAKRKIWSDYEDGKSSGSPPAKPEPRKLLLPDGTEINILTQYLPVHIPDKKYNELKEYLDKNKDTLDMYRSYINKNLFDILQQGSTPVDSEDVANLNLIDKSRDYFVQNVLSDGTGDINKCSNTESLNVEFDDDTLLSRLQLMLQMKVYNENDEHIRTDCFYAPDLYNHIVNRINNRLPVTNPFTNSIIQEDKLKIVIDDLIQIMKVLDPTIQRPYYVKPPHDTALFIKQVPLHSPSKQEFIQLCVMRKFHSMEVPLHNICVIPNDINPDSTGSTDISSAIFATTVEILFDKGILFHNYLPPYYVREPNSLRLLFIKPAIHFNNYSSISQWSNKTKEQQVEMMKHYLDELKQFLY